MEQERKTKIIGLVAVIVAVLGLTIAFAAMSRTLRINGTGKMDPVNWEIYFDNLSSATTVGEGVATGTPSLATKGASITNMNVTLKKPGDSVTYTVDIKNDGDIDAEISEINLPTLTTAQSTLFEFSATYTNEYEHGHTITVGDMLASKETRNITIVFKYKDITDESLLPNSQEAINLSYSINYVQSNNKITTSQASQGGGLVQNNCTPFMPKDTYSVGDEIALCDTTTGKSEDFYVISDNGTTVTALAKYNLYVGNIVQYDSNGENLISRIAITNSSPEYNLQSSSATIEMQNIRITGTVAFSSTNYWVENNNLKSNYGNSYPAWVFDSNSNLWTPVQNYQTYLRNTLGKTSVAATLLSKEQADAIKAGNNDSMPIWAYENSQYWLGSTYGSGVWSVHFDGDVGDSDFNYDGYCGVRPVITISKSDI